MAVKDAVKVESEVEETETEETETPETVVVKVNGADDLKKLLEKVRKEEKSKLYPQIEHWKKTSEESKSHLTALQAQVESLTAQIAAVKADPAKGKGEKNRGQTALPGARGGRTLGHSVLPP